MTKDLRDNLDPKDWAAYRSMAHDLLDQAMDHVESAFDRPVWKPIPKDLKRNLANEPLPVEGMAMDRLGQRVAEDLMAYGNGNTHPRFFGWVHGTGTAGGVISEMMAAAMNTNMGGRDHAPIYVERQVIEWCRQIFGLPEEAGGLLVSGTSMATLLSLATARKRHVPRIEELGMDGLERPLCLYVSDQAHNCIAKAATALGFAKHSVRRVRTSDQGAMDIAELEAMIRNDRADGLEPFFVVATAGSVNTGSFDNINSIAAVANKNELWLHVDGAFGGLVKLSETHNHLCQGIERAHSIAFDFHKWLHVPYAVGCVLIRDKRWQLDAFSERPDYLADQERGLAAGNPWFCEMGLELSRGFLALKVWMTLKEHGLKRLGEMITKNCAQARYLTRLVETSSVLELLSPTASNITNFRYHPETSLSSNALDQLNTEIVMRLQENGVAAPSTTKIGGVTSIRVNMTNHRTEMSDMDLLVKAVESEGLSLTTQAQAAVP